MWTRIVSSWQSRSRKIVRLCKAYSGTINLVRIVIEVLAFKVTEIKLKKSIVYITDSMCNTEILSIRNFNPENYHG